jgi:hypothetical protein
MPFDTNKFGIYCDASFNRSSLSDLIYTLYFIVPESLKDQAKLIRVSENIGDSTDVIMQDVGNMFSIRTRNGTSLQREVSANLIQTRKKINPFTTVDTDMHIVIGDLSGDDISYSNNLETFFDPSGSFIPNRNLSEPAYWQVVNSVGASPSPIVIDNTKTLYGIKFMKFTMQHEDDAATYFGSKTIRRSFDKLVMNLRFTLNGVTEQPIVNLYYNSASSFADGRHSFFSEDVKSEILNIVPDNVSFTNAINSVGATSVTDDGNNEIAVITTTPIDQSYNTYIVSLTDAYITYINGLNLGVADARTFVMNNVRDIVRNFDDADADSNGYGSTQSGEFDFNNNQVFILNNSLPFVTELEEKNVRVLNPKNNDSNFDMGVVNGEYGIYADLDSLGETLSLTTSSGAVVTIINRDQTLGRPQLRYFEVDISGVPSEKIQIGDANYLNLDYFKPTKFNTGNTFIDKLAFSESSPYSIKLTNDLGIANARIFDGNNNEVVDIDLIHSNGSIVTGGRSETSQVVELRIINTTKTWRDFDGKIKFGTEGNSNLFGGAVTITFVSNSSNILTSRPGELIVQNRLYESKTVMQVDETVIVLGSVAANDIDPNTHTYYTNTFASFINKMINDAALHDGTASATVIGDPHVYTLSNKMFTLDNKEQEWTYYEDKNIKITMNTRAVTEQERDEIHTYYKNVTGNVKVPNRLIANGVFVNKVTMVVDGKKIGYDYDNGQFFDETNGSVLIRNWEEIPEKIRTKFEKNQEASAAAIYLARNDARYCLMVCKYENPQMKYGIKLLTNAEQKHSSGLVC